ncbi:unnamed protein product [Rodentolepis nana]|uniref:Uncharacterized protein n=1 Tax=Rodentolepis nana TaxID=102285 RepID=A0A0R3TIH9_RODNA|nr:unnamed protein product [Rodentolepis nana]
MRLSSRNCLTLAKSVVVVLSRGYWLPRLCSQDPILTEHTAANRDIQLMPPPAISKRSIGLQTPSRKEFPNPVITTLSPGRSIDSQLNQISKDLGLNEREN